jgi:hypothetical protein
MLKPKTILALFEDGSDEAMKFALPYAADMLRKIIKENEDAAEAQYIKDEQEGKAMENDMTNLETDGILFQCTNCGQCFLFPFKTCPNCHKEINKVITTNLLVRANPIKTETLCDTCQRSIDCAFLPCCDCEMSDVECEAGSEEHYICKCTCVAEGEPCPFYIEYKE